LKENINVTENDILHYLYQNRLGSPQSLTKIKLALGLEDNREDNRLLKSSLQALIEKEFIKKQVDRGNYKIDDKGITEVLKQA
jgi:hypothetical protein